MGLLNETAQTYHGGSNLGGYQFISLDDVINNFMISYVGESKLISKISRTDVAFHAQRSVQEFSFDVFKSTKAYEIEVPNTLQMDLPQDYVNYIKFAIIDDSGVERVLTPFTKTSNPTAISQNADGTYQYEGDGSYTEQSESDSWKNFKSVSPNNKDDYTNLSVYNEGSYDPATGRRYGLEPSMASKNGFYYIDDAKGKVHFSSNVVGKTVILKYMSDGLGTDAEMKVHKFAEEAMYKRIAYAILTTRSNVPEYVVNRVRKEAAATKRTANIRLANLNIEEITQALRGMSKPIKN